MEGDGELKRALPILLRRIKQEDNFSFSVEWNDNSIGLYRLSELQKKCPCAGCVDENTGKRISDPTKVSATLRAIKITSVGRYAMKIQFREGCSAGIFTFDMLYQMKTGD